MLRVIQPAAFTSLVCAVHFVESAYAFERDFRFGVSCLYDQEMDIYEVSHHFGSFISWHDSAEQRYSELVQSMNVPLLLELSVVPKHELASSSKSNAGNSHLMIVSKQFIKKIKCFGTDKALIFCVDKTLPTLLWKSAENIVILLIKFNIVLVEVFEKIICTKYFGDFDQLIRVAVTVKEWFFSEDHRSKHSTE